MHVCVGVHDRSKVLEHPNSSSFSLKMIQFNVSLHSEMKAYYK